MYHNVVTRTGEGIDARAFAECHGSAKNSFVSVTVNKSKLNYVIARSDSDVAIRLIGKIR